MSTLVVVVVQVALQGLFSFLLACKELRVPALFPNRSMKPLHFAVGLGTSDSGKAMADTPGLTSSAKLGQGRRSTLAARPEIGAGRQGEGDVIIGQHRLKPIAEGQFRCQKRIPCSLAGAFGCEEGVRLPRVVIHDGELVDRLPTPQREEVQHIHR